MYRHARVERKKSKSYARNLAKDFLNDLIAQKKVSIRRITKDRYGHAVAELFKDEINVQELPLRGWVRYTKICLSNVVG